MDRFEDLRTFVLVGELRSVTKAAKQLQRAPSAVSRRLSELETRLGTQLLTRTTRQIVLTDAGERFLTRAQQILTDLQEAEECAGKDSQTLTGLLKLTTPLSFGLSHLGPAITDFMTEHPSLSIDVELSDLHLDLVASRMDLAVRIGTLPDSTLKSRRLAPIRHAVVAAPAFWEQHGIPQVPGDLAKLPGLCYSNLAAPGRWTWQHSTGEQGFIEVVPRLLANNGDALLQAAIRGLGVTRGPTFLMHQAIEQRELQPVLLDYQWGDAGLFAVYPDTRFVPGRTRAFIDYLTTCFGDDPVWDHCLRDNATES